MKSREKNCNVVSLKEKYIIIKTSLLTLKYMFISERMLICNTYISMHLVFFSKMNSWWNLMININFSLTSKTDDCGIPVGETCPQFRSRMALIFRRCPHKMSFLWELFKSNTYLQLANQWSNGTTTHCIKDLYIEQMSQKRWHVLARPH